MDVDDRRGVGGEWRRCHWSGGFAGDFAAVRPVGGFVLSSVDVPRGVASIPHAGRPRTRVFRVGDARGRRPSGEAVVRKLPPTGRLLSGKG